MHVCYAAILRLVAVFGLVYTLSGCVMTPEGPLFTLSDIAEPLVNKRFARYEGIRPDFNNPFPDMIGVKPDSRQGIIVIGRLSAYREFGEKLGETSTERGYRNYVASFQKGRPDISPTLTFEEFDKSIHGWTQIQIYGAALIVASYYRALVPLDLVNDLRFENPIHSFAVYDSADLVAAESNDDGALIVLALLCKEGPGFSECESQYQKGVFDLVTGLELTARLNPKSFSGELIDPISYKLLRKRDKFGRIIEH